MFVEFELTTGEVQLIVVCEVVLGDDGFEKVSEIEAWTSFDNEEYELQQDQIQAIEEAAGREYWKRRSFDGTND